MDQNKNKKAVQPAEKKHSNKKIWKIILGIIILLLLISSSYFIYNILLLGPIEPVLRYIATFILIVIDIVFILKYFLLFKKKKKKKNYLLFACFATIYLIVNVLLGLAINVVYNSLDNINKDNVTYSTSLLVLNNADIKTIDDLSDKTIGIIDDQNSIEGYIISQDIIKENKLTEKNDLEEYSNFSEMVSDLYLGYIDAIFISSNYEIMFKNIEGYENIKSDTLVLTTKEKTMKKQKIETSEENLVKPDKKTTEPFTVLLMGVDSEVDGLDKNAAANGDSLMLVTFNPQTFNITMLSIPRDTYVPIACFANKLENKITHAAWYGESCMIKTIQNLTGITIDYYAKINFKGVVSLVDALGGIEVDVPQDLCTDDSNRANEICISKGWQRLNGEQALVLSRNRYDLANGDIGRGLNQQLVIQGIVNSAKNIRSVNQVLDILNTVSRNMDTNFTTEQILSFYNIFKAILTKSFTSDNNELVNIQQLFLSGSGQMIYEEGMKMVLWNYIPNKSSLNAVIKEMKVNLELEQHEVVKTFTYSINEPYEKEIIGQNPTSPTSLYTLLPDFTGKTKEYVSSWANKFGITVNFVEEFSNSSSGTVINQSLPASKRLDRITETLTITLAKKQTTTSTKIDCSLDENSDNKKCIVPNFSEMTKNEATSWAKGFKNVKIIFNEVTNLEYEHAAIGQIVAQDISYGKYLKDTTKITLTIVVPTTEESDNEEKEDNNKEEAEKENNDIKKEETTE